MPTFSVIVPTMNRPGSLAACLGSFMQLDYPLEDWELIVVNDGGTSSFATITPKIEHMLPLRLLHIEHGGPAAARNAGIRIATGDYLAFTDDDCRIAPDWLRCLTEGFAETGADALGGKTLNPFPDDTGACASQHLIDFFYDYLQDRSGNALMLVSNNAAYHRPALETVGGFNESFPLAAAEDLELGYRVVAHGFRQKYYPKATVFHDHPLTWQGHLKQQFRYGRGGYYFQREQQEQHTQIPLRSSRPFYLALGRSLWRNGLLWRLAVIVLLGQIIYRVGKVYQAFEAKL